MPGSAVNNVDGSSITFESGFFAQIQNISWSGITREQIDTSHIGLSDPSSNQIANKTFMPAGISDPGELEIEMHFNPDTDPPIDSAAATCTLTFPLISGDMSAASWAASAFMTEFSFTGEMEGKYTATAKLKFSGVISITDAA